MTKFNIKKILLKDLLRLIDDKSYIKKNQYIHSLSSFDLNLTNNLAFIDKVKFNKIKISDVKASCIIVPKKINSYKNIIINKNPRFLFEKICRKIIKNYNEEIFVEPIKKNYQVGKGTLISKFSKIEDGVKIGDNVIIYKNTHIKKNAIISSGSVIGNVGVGPYLVNGKYVNCTHLGGVIIEKNSYIGSNTVITRGTLSNTIIGENTYISNLVNIGHNVKIGKYNLISSSVCVGGGTKTGKKVEIALGSTINANLKIGNNCKIAINTNVIKNLKNNEHVFGNPAKRIFLTKNIF
jgi:UDP-3-O-[3-hydroxymyristoyl] glucosamine N-acyltransferase LpxD|tara:strand:+ start:742 stop:1623 length:882 start_codon:yes stop_codon:yes gene_type:complete